MVAKEEKAHDREETEVMREEWARKEEAEYEERVWREESAREEHELKEDAEHEECEARKEEAEQEECEHAHETERMKEEMRMKIELARIQLEIEAVTRAHTTPDTSDVWVMVNNPKLPTFDEKRDNLDAYLERFECFAVSQHWNREDWAVCLSPLLTVKALQMYTSMPSENAHDNDHLIVALLKK